MKLKLIAVLALSVVSATNAGDKEITDLINSENELRVVLFEMAAAHNEISSKEKLDEVINLNQSQIIRAINQLKVDHTHCEKLASVFYDQSQKPGANDRLYKMGATTKMVDDFNLASAAHAEAVCNAYLTR